MLIPKAPINWLLNCVRLKEGRRTEHSSKRMNKNMNKKIVNGKHKLMQLPKQYSLGSVNRSDPAFPQKKLWETLGNRNNETDLDFKSFKLHFLSCQTFRENQGKKVTRDIDFQICRPWGWFGMKIPNTQTHCMLKLRGSSCFPVSSCMALKGTQQELLPTFYNADITLWNQHLGFPGAGCCAHHTLNTSLL